jgi:hypothetical protein
LSYNASFEPCRSLDRADHQFTAGTNTEELLMRRTLFQPASVILLLGLLGAGFVFFYWSDNSNKSRTVPEIESGTTTRTFEGLHNTKVQGRLNLNFGDTSVIIGVHLENAQSRARYNNHLHRGSCRIGGSGGIQLEPVKTTSGGTGTSRTRVAYQSLNPTFDHLVMVHRPDQKHILCAGIPAVSTMKQHAPATGGSSDE